MRHTVGILFSVMAGLLTASIFAAEEAQPPQGQIGRAERAGQDELFRQQANLAAAEAARIGRGFRVAPVRLDLRGKDPLLVGLGSYLVNTAGGCNDCHTNPPFAPGGDPFAGEPKQVNTTNYLAGGVAFGPFTSRNLTPDATNGLPAGLTYDQFRETIRTGRDLKQLHPEIPLLQVMPWPVYQTMTERDLRAIYEYLRAIPHAEPGS
jgi:hypothetical protein